MHRNKDLEKLDVHDLREIHELYLNELGSLGETAKYVAEKYQIDVNRHHLSYHFHRLGWYVKPPNGRPQKHWRETNYHLDEYSRFASKWLEDLWLDILGYERGTSSKIAYQSACAAVSGRLYELCMQSILRNVEWRFDTSVIPSSITIEEIVKGATAYNNAYRYWVEGIVDD